MTDTELMFVNCDRIHHEMYKDMELSSNSGDYSPTNSWQPGFNESDQHLNFGCGYCKTYNVRYDPSRDEIYCRDCGRVFDKNDMIRMGD